MRSLVFALAVLPVTICGIPVKQPPSPNPSPVPSPPPVTVPAPSPSPSPLPTVPPTPQPIPSPAPSPIPPTEGRDLGEGWTHEEADKLWVKNALPDNEDPESLFGEAVNEALVQVSGCHDVGGRCELQLFTIEQFFRAVNTKLRAKGYSTGVDFDQIVVCFRPDRANLCEAFHVYNTGGPTVVWFKDKTSPNKGAYRATEFYIGNGYIPPPPEPSPSPTAPPTAPPPIEQHAPPTVSGGPTTIHPGQTANLKCSGASAGWPITHFEPHLAAGSKARFNWSGGDPGNTLSITARGDGTSGLINVYCELRDDSDPSHVTSPNFHIQVVVP